MNTCPICQARAQVIASQQEEIEFLRDEKALLLAELVARENHQEEVTAMLIAHLTEGK